MDIDQTLNKLETDLAGLLSDTPPAELRDFATKRDFLAYAAEQIELAKADTDPEVRKSRLQHLFVNVGVAKNGFEDGSATALPVYSGPFSVQAQTAWAERSEKTISSASAAASGQPGPLGFAMKDADGKPLTAEMLVAAFNALLVGDLGKHAHAEPDPDPPGTPAPETPSEETPPAGDPAPEPDGDKEETAKAKGDPWGSAYDMNFKPSDDKDEFSAGSIRSF